jgi:hypothetical protein
MVWILSTATPAEFGVTGGVLAVAALLYVVRARRLRRSFGAQGRG